MKSGIAVDSRKVKPGYTFVATQSGEKFIVDAIKNGAIKIIVAENSEIKSVEGAELIRAPNPRIYLSEAAVELYPLQPETIVGITGTNGKTSTAYFYKQICTISGLKSGCIGTLGVISDAGIFDNSDVLTSPDAPELHQTLDELARKGVNHVALEVSSIGVHQHRVDNVKFKAVAFTNLTQDHLDYHVTMEEYFNAKARLFAEVIDTKTIAILNADIPEFEELTKICNARKLKYYSYGFKGTEFRVVSHEAKMLTIEVLGKKYSTPYYLAGEFQLYNTLCAIALAVATGISADKAIFAMKDLQAAPGRMEKVARYNGAQIFIDYAHTPDALEKALQTLRKETKSKLVVVFGCGGDRDATKRPIMGSIAAKYADLIFVTDDNPRSEVPAYIRKEVMAGCPKAREASPREVAIHEAVNSIDQGDILLVAGKGHENYQIIGEKKLPFSDTEQIIKHVT